MVAENNEGIYREPVKPGQRVIQKSGDDIVITGIAGNFPDADGMAELSYNLYNNIDMISGDNRRWKLDHPEIPQRTGKLKEVDKFDASSFGLHYNQAECMDPMSRILLEKSYEAIIDSGINPYTLKGSKTGVFVGSCFSESETRWLYETLQVDGFGVTGCLRTMMAQRVSYAFGFDGPSYVVDSACSSSMYALEQAYSAIREGYCDSALIAGCNLCLHPYVSLQFTRLGALSHDGRCKVFDEEADGYCRSETVAAVFIQKKNNARRMYANLVHVKTNCDGYKEQGITYPSGETQEKLLREFYEECSVDPASLAWVEAHGTGTKVGDPEEVRALYNALCKNRSTPLKVGSVKSNLGHTEPSSGVCSIAKVILAMETGVIPPNINLKNPRSDIEYFHTGEIEVVTEPTPWEGGKVAVNSFGFGGANCHALLEWNPKTKQNGGLPQDDIPRLINVSGRTVEAVDTILKFLEENSVDVEFIKLLQDIHKDEIPSHLHRGYTILTKDKSFSQRRIEYFGLRKNIYINFSALSTNWTSLDKSILQFPIFHQSLLKMSQAVNIDILHMITDSSYTMKNPAHYFVAVIATQIAFYDLLTSIGMKVDGYFGTSLGILACAYADGCLTSEQAILATYNIAVSLCQSSGKRHYNPTTSNLLLLSKALVLTKSKIMDSLNKIITHGKCMSPKWLNSSAEIDRCNAAYIYETLISNANIDFDENILAEDILIVNMGEKGVYENLDYSMQEILDNSGCDSCSSFLVTIGRLYIAGMDADLSKLYPKVSYPVSRATPMIAPLVRWNHDKTWYVLSYEKQKKIGSGEMEFSVSLTENESAYISGHMIDGRNLYPATGYLALVWETIGLMKGKHIVEVPVVFENVRFLRATHMTKDGHVDFTVIIQRVSGNFEIVEGGAAIVSGRVYVPEDVAYEMSPFHAPAHYDKAFTLSSKDIYKELRLRGYNYSGLFRSVMGLNVEDKVATVRWHNNWVAFMDNMLQIHVAFKDTRGLFVPTYLDQLIIDGRKHLQAISSISDVAVHYFQEANLLKCGGIEIRGLKANAIARKKNLAEAVLEKYQFVPNKTLTQVYDLCQILRMFLQIIIENEQNTINVKAVELLSKTEENGILAPTVADVLSDLPLIQADITVLANPNVYEEALPPGVTIEDKKLNTDQSALVLIVNNLFEGSQDLSIDDCLNAIKPEGYIMAREEGDAKVESDKVTVLSSHALESGRLMLLRKTKKAENGMTQVIHVSDAEYSWMTPAQNAIKTKECSRVICYAQDGENSGVLGFVNCLRKEGDGAKARCVLLMDREAPQFELEDNFYKEQLNLDLAVNVYKNGQWGTYRHLKIDEKPKNLCSHVCANVLVRGDLSSLSWLQGHITDFKKPGLIFVHYAALNFRDIMLASGKIASEVVGERKDQDCVIGFECSGFDIHGNRLMAMLTNSGLSTIIQPDPLFSWKIPDEWSLEQGASVPVVYATVLYALILRGRIRKGESILIHSGTGGVGQAAINIALSKGCTIFTTVGTQEKRDYIREQFPEIADTSIGNSRDTSFEQLVMRETNGRGVDLVLNSLAEEKLLASVRCLARGGRFLEIGKYDLINNSPLGMELFSKGASFHGIVLDAFLERPPSEKIIINKLLTECITEGSVKPIPCTVFKHAQIETAFRYMATGKHIGKVLIDVRSDQKDVVPNNEPVKIEGSPRFYCKTDKSYIIIGGLGGFGMELADWLILRKAKRIVLTSRKGISNGYQEYRINLWRSYGVDVQVLTDDITTEEGIKSIINTASKMAPVAGIFNLAVILKDAIFENLTENDFKTSLGPKAVATRHLDRLTRLLCPKLEVFVIFSSVSCGRGNAGQTNYGMANSIMERICEQRVADGLPALAIQWGAVGDVGLVAEMMDEHNVEVVIGGTLLQRIISCLAVMDEFLMTHKGVVSSMIVAEKKSRSSSSDNILDTVANILGIRDLKTVSFHSNLAELGMDSMMAVEIKQTLEREFEVFLSPQDIRGMTLAKLQDIAAAKESEETQEEKYGHESEISLPQETKIYIGQMIYLEPEKYEPIVKLNSLNNGDANDSKSRIFLVPGIEGFPVIFENLACLMSCEVYCLPLDYTTYHNQISAASEAFLYHLVPYLTEKTFNIVGYSYGGVISMDLVVRLEKLGYRGNLILIDSSPELMIEIVKTELSKQVDDSLQVNLILRQMEFIGFGKIGIKVEEELRKLPEWEMKIDFIYKLAEKANLNFSEQFIKDWLSAVYNRAVSMYFLEKFPDKCISSNVSLIKPTQITLPGAEDYGLSKYCQQPVSVYHVEGTHQTVLNNTNTASIISEIINIGTPSTEKASIQRPSIDITVMQEKNKQI